MRAHPRVCLLYVHIYITLGSVRSEILRQWLSAYRGFSWSFRFILGRMANIFFFCNLIPCKNEKCYQMWRKIIGRQYEIREIYRCLFRFLYKSMETNVSWEKIKLAKLKFLISTSQTSYEILLYKNKCFMERNTFGKITILLCIYWFVKR